MIQKQNVVGKKGIRLCNITASKINWADHQNNENNEMKEAINSLKIYQHFH